MAGVQDHLEPAALDRLGVDDAQDGRQVPSIGILDRPRPAQRFPARPAKFASLPAIEHGASLRLAQDHAGPLEELEAVVLGWIVRRRDLNAAGRLQFPDEDPDRRRGRGAGEEDVVAGRGDAGLHGRREDRGRDPSIVTHDDRTWLALARVGRGELDGDRRVESVAHDASQTRDAGDPRTASAHRRWPSTHHSVATTRDRAALLHANPALVLLT